MTEDRKVLTIALQIRLTPAEYEMLKQQAGAKGLKLASYLRSLIYEHQKKEG